MSNCLDWKKKILNFYFPLRYYITLYNIFGFIITTLHDVSNKERYQHNTPLHWPLSSTIPKNINIDPTISPKKSFFQTVSIEVLSSLGHINYSKLPPEWTKVCNIHWGGEKCKLFQWIVVFLARSSCGSSLGWIQLRDRDRVR